MYALESIIEWYGFSRALSNKYNKIIISMTGRILVTDSNNQCVQAFGPHGEIRLKFGVRGRCPGQMQRPTGICHLPNGHIAVADYDNKWVSVFDQMGKFVNKIGAGKLLGMKL